MHRRVFCRDNGIALSRRDEGKLFILVSFSEVQDSGLRRNDECCPGSFDWTE